MTARIVPLAALVCALVASHQARAQTASGRPTNPQAVAHFQQGNAHYKVRDFEMAAQEYKAGELIEAAPIFDFNLGQCYRQLTKYQDAIWHYERYVRSGFATQDDITAINKWIDEMRAEMEQRAKSSPPTDAATMQQPAPTATPVHVTPSTPPASPRSHDTVGWVLTGSGVVALAVGGGLIWSASSLRDQANATPNQGDQNSLRDQANTRSLVGGTLAAVGGALIVGGAIKFITHDTGQTADQPTVSAGISGTSLIVFGQF